MSNNNPENATALFIIIGAGVLFLGSMLFDWLRVLLLPLTIALIAFGTYKLIKFMRWFDSESERPYAIGSIALAVLISLLMYDAGGFITKAKAEELKECSRYGQSDCDVAYRGKILFMFKPYELCNDEKMVTRESEVCLNKPLITFLNWNVTKIGKLDDMRFSFENVQQQAFLSKVRFSKASSFCDLVIGLDENDCEILTPDPFGLNY